MRGHAILSAGMEGFFGSSMAKAVWLLSCCRHFFVFRFQYTPICMYPFSLILALPCSTDKVP